MPCAQVALKILFVLLLIEKNIISSDAWKAKILCSKEDFSKLNQCFDQSFMMKDGAFRFPADLEEGNYWCKGATESSDCISKLSSKCLIADSVSNLDILMSHLPPETKELCSNSEKMAKLVGNLACLAPLEGEMSLIFSNFSKVLSKSSKTKVSICCKVFKFKELFASLQSLSNCTDESKEYFSDLGEKLTAEIEDVLCPIISSSKDESCQVTSVEDEDEDEDVLKDDNESVNGFIALLLSLDGRLIEKKDRSS